MPVVTLPVDVDAVQPEPGQCAGKRFVVRQWLARMTQGRQYAGIGMFTRRGLLQQRCQRFPRTHFEEGALREMLQQGIDTVGETHPVA